MNGTFVKLSFRLGESKVRVGKVRVISTSRGILLLKPITTV